ncbi:50S ribosomal protein L21 [Candidatus Nitrosoglobus terrae]|uniref:Large ribosomal subunit protein bL21 n=1 Tax=Candidatus Nitrosoglobus terrae TaxID=1630141 RepID=A0A1Q2SJZ9_9GAMM|nr:50S ribosomal protein L21 [Candidatus Nitrosoglobus terrae]BAW79430.1 50S ribosomal protein L21 [Candidatus Nitrosoglobus terrae]
MYAVIKTGGKQYRVQEGDILRVEKINADEGANITLDQVLLVANEDSIQVGTPYINGGKVSATIQNHGRGKKITIIKFRRRKHFRKRMGHRQYFTELHIDSISTG